VLEHSLLSFDGVVQYNADVPKALYLGVICSQEVIVPKCWQSNLEKQYGTVNGCENY